MSEADALKDAPKMLEELENRLRAKGVKIQTVKEACEQALQEHAAEMALRSIRPPSHSAEGLRIAILNAWHKLAELKADPAKFKTTQELLESISTDLIELESLTDQYLNFTWQATPGEDINSQFLVLKAFASGVSDKIARETDNTVTMFRRVLDENEYDKAAVILILECQIIRFDLFRFLLSRTIDQMPYYPDPRLPH
jgi:hypothetical protein